MDVWSVFAIHFLLRDTQHQSTAGKDAPTQTAAAVAAYFTDLLKAAPCTVNIHHQTNRNGERKIPSRLDADAEQTAARRYRPPLT